jgi:nucleoside-diphosphate-sugar epimerase
MPTSKKIEIISEKNKYRQSDRPQLVADISKSVELLNWVPKINLEAGLKIILKKEGLL